MAVDEDLSARGDAEAAVACAPSDPTQALALASGALAVAAGRDPLTEVLARRALGIAERRLGRLVAARAHLDRAVGLADRLGLGRLGALARSSRALLHLDSGGLEAALADLEQARPQLEGEDAAELSTHRALVLQRLGRYDEALADYRDALGGLPAEGSAALARARVLSNRGVLRAYLGDLAGAEEDLEAALRLYERAGTRLAAAEVRHNLGFVALRRGDLPAALAAYDEAGRVFAELGVERPSAAVDRVEALLVAGLYFEARDLASSTVAQLEARGLGADLAEARLALAEAALAAGDLEVASAAASAASEAFTGQGRLAWAARAAFAAAQARWRREEHSGSTREGRAGEGGILEEAETLARTLEEAGWLVPALECRLIGARVAVDRGDLDKASSLLRDVAPASPRAPASVRMRSWHATALLRLAKGDRRGALSALQAGLAVAEAHRATLGATELRARAASQASELAALGVAVVADHGRPDQLLRWVERWRAQSLVARPLRPPRDPALAAALDRLRHIAARAEQAVLEGDDASSLLQEQSRLENEVRAHARRVAARGEAGRFPLPPPADLERLLAGRALVELVAVDGRLVAVVVVDGIHRLVELGPAEGVGRDVVRARFALGQLARGRVGAASREAARRSLLQTTESLDRFLFGPLEGLVGGRELVIVPTGELHALPWSALPSLWSRAFTVAPSAALWAARQSLARRPRVAALAPARRTVLVAGPRLEAGDEEVARLSRLYSSATTLRGPFATSAPVLRALEGAAVAHLAVHGTFRGDNPLFSSLELVDGPVMVYDLEELSPPPELIVLSACDAGRASTSPGDELVGTGAALLAGGARAVVASLSPMPDRGAARFALSFHGALLEGEAPAEALARARRETAPSVASVVSSIEGDDRRDLLAAVGFVCFGAG